MKIAVIKSGGKQYKVQKDALIKVELLNAKESTKLDFEDILDGKKVKAQVLEHKKGPKIKILKFKNKTRYTRRMGHRQKYTSLKILDIK